MEKKTNKKNPYRINYENYLDTNASTELTGLMYQPAEDGAKWEEYQEVFDFFPGNCQTSRNEEKPAADPKENQ